jgi:putative transposase
MGIKRPPRLAGFSYVGRHRYFLTICTEGRLAAFADLDAGHSMVTNFLHAAEAYGFAVIAYCLMPDHLHVLLQGVREDSDLRRFVWRWKQDTGFEWSKRTGQRLWQEGYFDRVQRPEDTDLFTVAYIAVNPVREGLAPEPHQYPFFGCSRYTREQVQKAMEIAGFPE